MSKTEPFRTASGSTGKDAYQYELAQIRNCMRELEARYAALAETIAREIPDGATAEHDMGPTNVRINAATAREMARFDAQDIRMIGDLTTLVNTLKLPLVASAAELRTPAVEAALKLVRETGKSAHPWVGQVSDVCRLAALDLGMAPAEVQRQVNAYAAAQDAETES